MAIAGGTCGTCTWSISDTGALTVAPTSGSSGYLVHGFVATNISRWPWGEYANRITSASFSGSVRSCYEMFTVTEDGKFSYMFEGCTALASVSGLSSLTGATDLRHMFSGCTSLTSVNLGGLNASDVDDMGYMFQGCTSLSSIDFGGIDTGAVKRMDYMFRGCTSLASVNLSALDTSAVTNMDSMFNGCSSLTSVNLGGLDTGSVTDMDSMFCRCSSLTSLDLSPLDTSAVEDMFYMFYGTDLLTAVTFGPSFAVPPVESQSINHRTHFVQSGKSCANLSNGITVTSDEVFANLTNADRAGTWDRGVDATFSATATRTTGGQADEDGESVTIAVTYATDSQEPDRTLRVYMKAASDASYSSTATATRELSGDSGTATVTISNVGDAAYDFRVEFYDGESTFVAFPSVQSNIRLVEFDKSGNVNIVSGMLKLAGEDAFPLFIWDSTHTVPTSFTGPYPILPCFVYYTPDNGLYYVPDDGTNTTS